MLYSAGMEARKVGARKNVHWISAGDLPVALSMKARWPVCASNGLRPGIGFKTKEKMMRKYLWGLGLIALVSGSTRNSHSACGLNFCPRLEPKGENAFDLGIMVKQVHFNLEGTSGSYTGFMPDVAYILHDRWTFGVNLPIIFLDVDGHVETGISNPMGFAEFRFQPGPGQRMGFGMQLELPLGNDEKGMAGNHFMAVPYLSWAKAMHPFFIGGSAGGSFGISGGHSHGEGDAASHHGSGSSTLYVNPHENMELLYRIAGGTNLWNKRVNPEISLNGQHVLTDVNTQGNSDNYLSLGLAAPMLFGRITVSPNFEMPLADAKRFDWGAGMTASIKL